MQLQFLINNQYMRRMDTMRVVADSENYLEAYFMCSYDWQNINKTAVFSDGTNCYEMLVIDNKCAVPAAVIKHPSFKVGLFGGRLLTTNYVEVTVEESSLPSDLIETPVPEDIYDQILDYAVTANTNAKTAISIAESIEERANNGEFNGADGADGEDGATFTPEVDDEGNISWTNDKGLTNPETKNIMGPEGPQGKPGLSPYVGTNGHWWVGNRDTGYSATVDVSQIEELDTKITELATTVSSLSESVITEEEVTSLITDAITAHNEDENAHEELFDEYSATWNTI